MLKGDLQVFQFSGNYHRLVKDGRVKRILQNAAPELLHLFLFNDVIFITQPDRWHKHTSLQWRHDDHDGVSKWPASRVFAQAFIQAQIKENIKAMRHWPLLGKFTGDRCEFPAQMASNAENVYIWWRHHVLSRSTILFLLYNVSWKSDAM